MAVIDVSVFLFLNGCISSSVPFFPASQASVLVATLFCYLPLKKIDKKLLGKMEGNNISTMIVVLVIRLRNYFSGGVKESNQLL